MGGTKESAIKRLATMRAKAEVLGYDGIFSPESRNKMSVSHKGKEQSSVSNDKRSVTLTGRKMPPRKPEWYANQTASKKGKHCGQNNPNWKGGTSSSPYFYGSTFTQELRNFIKHIFGGTCYLCGCVPLNGKKGGNVHHIDYNKKNSSVFNLVYLCRSCHGKTNGNRIFYTKLFQECLGSTFHRLFKRINMGRFPLGLLVAGDTELEYRIELIKKYFKGE